LGSPLEENSLQRVRLQAIVRQDLADRICATGMIAETVDVFPRGAKGESILSFRCERSRGRLVPRRLERADKIELVSIERMAARKRASEEQLGSFALEEAALTTFLSDTEVLATRPPVLEFIHVARQRAEAREFDEAIRLLDKALENATLLRARTSELYRLRDEIRAAADER
jgi:hypothetical protein